VTLPDATEAFEAARENELSLLLDVLADDLLWGKETVEGAMLRFEQIKERFRVN